MMSIRLSPLLEPLGSSWITTNRPAESLSHTILVPVTLWLPFAVP